MLCSHVNADVTCFPSLDGLESAVSKSRSLSGKYSAAVQGVPLSGQTYTLVLSTSGLWSASRQGLPLPKDLETVAACSPCSVLRLLMALSYCLGAAQSYPALD